MRAKSSLQVTLRTVGNAVGVSPRTAVGIPPSSVDPVSDEMRVDVGGRIILRAFDPGAAIVTGAPLTFATEGGDDLHTEAGDNLTTEVA